MSGEFMGVGQAAGYPSGTQLGTHVDQNGFMTPALRHSDGSIQHLPSGGYSSLRSHERDCYVDLTRLGWSEQVALKMCHGAGGYFKRWEQPICVSTAWRVENGRTDYNPFLDKTDMCYGARNSLEEECRTVANEKFSYRNFPFEVSDLCHGARSLYPIDCAIDIISETGDFAQAVQQCNQKAINKRITNQRARARREQAQLALHYKAEVTGPTGEIDGAYCE